jgi:vitamin B12/bleomycin/antimicrobial peptide transport system ATP-binding/permease protein
MALARPFWRSEERWRAGLLLGAVVSLSLAQTWVGVRLSYWNRSFFDTIQRGDYGNFVQLGVSMLGLIFCSITFWLAEDYLFSSLKIRWRRWMTARFLEKWLGDRAHYLGQLNGHEGDNPDQRISEDIRAFCFTTLDLFMGLFGALSGLGSFVVILWILSSGAPSVVTTSLPLILPKVPEEFAMLSPLVGTLWTGYERATEFLTAIPGHLVWFCMLYSFLGTWLVGRVGRPIIGLNYEQQKLEADFRFGLIRLRENSESTALIEGEPAEHRTLGASFSRIVGNFNATLLRQIHLNAFKAVYFRLSDVVPLLLSAPRFFVGGITLGQLTQLTGAFGRVQSSLNFFVNSFETIANWWAIAQRLDGFTRGIEHSRRLREAQRQLYDRGFAGNALEAEGLTLFRPDGSALLAPVNFHLSAGDSVLITGASGCGKSTLLRALAGLWPYEQGRVHLPEPFRCMVMPQKPYLPIGSLRAALCYPSPPDAFPDESVQAALHFSQAPALIPRIAEEAHWSQQLSGGEQQRVALARIFLQRPDWLMLDEATSAMDEAAERAFYLALREILPDVAILTIAHRSTLRAVHARHFRVESRTDGVNHLVEVNNAMSGW